MAILYEKLIKAYDRKYLIEKLGRALESRLKRNEFGKFETVVMRVDIPTDYTYEDFLIDYGARYEKYKEKKTLFNILKAGKVMRQMSIEAGLLDNAVLLCVYNGFTDKAEAFPLILPYMKETFEIKEIINTLDFELFDNHLELYGKRENLEEFRIKYNIDCMILPHPKKKMLHLAFDGRIFKVFEYIIKNPQS